MRLLPGAVMLVALALPKPAEGSQAVEKSEMATLEILAVAVEPSSPGPDTLCELRVEIANRGHAAASRFAFEVRVGGRELPVYQDELVLQPIAPGESAVIRLHNFWSSETGRPFPEDGKLVVEVTLSEARWVRVDETHGARRPVGEVEGLPVSGEVTLRPPSRRDEPQ